MVFGNMGDDSATGVAFTRNPATGQKELYGEYLVNAQGEDVVAGIRTPSKIVDLKRQMPEAYAELEAIAQKLEQHYKEMQDIEFTIEHGKLYMLQTRGGKRTAQAAVRIAVDFVTEGIIEERDALLMVEANQLPQILLPSFDPDAKAQHNHPLLGVGLGASIGAATGKVVFHPDEAEKLGLTGEQVILVRPETVPDDIHGMIAAKGILTTRGGTTSHAAVVARGMGKPCVAGCESLVVDLKKETLTAGDRVIQKGEIISIDGATGEVFLGEMPTVEPKLQKEFETLMTWSDKYRTLGVRANADTPEDAKKARELGAKGIGLCRTEHMFMSQDRLGVMQRMIIADSVEERRRLLELLLPMQHEDFKGIFKAMESFPVTIRLLDPPLHEFLPNVESLIEDVAVLKWTAPDSPELTDKERLLKKVMQLKESNPMLGFRGCRLGLVYPEINEMQVRAIFEAATDLIAQGVQVHPEIMIPLVGSAEELRRLRDQLETVAREVMTTKKTDVPYLFGTMIEVPRAALTADEIARYADFFSFGTNDLTQMTFGYSRDDAEGRFMSFYLDHDILKFNPFETLDVAGVGQLILMTREKAYKVRPDIKLGICGEHGGEAQSVAFCHQAGLNYVSCSPFRVPVARVAGAQAAIQQDREKQNMSQDLDLIPV
jgi:pyruvate, orthophosphate dikinase